MGGKGAGLGDLSFVDGVGYERCALEDDAPGDDVAVSILVYDTKL